MWFHLYETLEKWKLICKTGITESYYKCAFYFQRIFILLICLYHIVSFSLGYFFFLLLGLAILSLTSGHILLKVVSKRLFECILYWELKVVSCRQSRADLLFLSSKIIQKCVHYCKDCFVLPFVLEDSTFESSWSHKIFIRVSP